MHYDCHALNITQDFFHPHTRALTPIYQSYQWGHQTKKYNYSAVHTPVRYWPQGGWWTVILPDWLRGSQGWVWSDPLPPRSSFIEAVNYTLASLTVLANGFVKTWFQIMALLRHTARKPYCHHKFYTIIYKKKTSSLTGGPVKQCRSLLGFSNSLIPAQMLIIEFCGGC